MPKTTQKALAASLMAGLLAVSAATAAHAQTPGTINDAAPCLTAPATPVTTGAAFNNPVAGRATGVVEQICNLVNQTAPGSKIQIANFVISGTAGMDFADTLLAAHSRGVDVQIVIDGWQIDKPAAAKLINELGVDESAASWVHVCSHKSPEGNTSSCIGTKGQHNKFYLFSETGGEHDVVVQSSANFTDVNSKTYWNNALTITDNHKLYEGYAAYFDDLVAEIQQPDYYRTVTAGMRGGKVTAHFFPSATVDPILERLSELGCKTTGNTEIRIGMSEWDDNQERHRRPTRGNGPGWLHGAHRSRPDGRLHPAATHHAARNRTPRTRLQRTAGPDPFEVPDRGKCDRKEFRPQRGYDRQPQLQRNLAAPQRRSHRRDEPPRRLPAVPRQLRTDVDRRTVEPTGRRARISGNLHPRVRLRRNGKRSAGI